MMLADELGAERRRHDNAGREVGILVKGQALAVSERVGIEGREEVGLIVLRIFPICHGSGQIGVQGVGEDLEKGSGSL